MEAWRKTEATMANLMRRRSPGGSLWRDVDRMFDDMLAPRTLRREIERLFDEFFEPSKTWTEVGEFRPKLELVESENEYVLTAELPGMREGDITIDIDENNVLTVRGEKREEVGRKARGYEYSERTYGKFVRSVQLPAGVDGSKVEAVYKDGLLEVHLPKTAKAQVRAIPIGHEKPEAEATASAEAGAGGNGSEKSEKTEETARGEESATP